jgi:hypothetical protein
MERTLIIAVDLEGFEIQGAYLFCATHKDGLNIKEALEDAWKAWGKTKKGKAYLYDNGTNWGDCTSLPEEVLADQGIQLLECIEGYCKEGIVIDQAAFQHKMVVNHNDSFLDFNRRTDGVLVSDEK